MVTKETVKKSLEARWLMRSIAGLSVAYVIIMLAVVVFRTEFKTNGFLFFVVFMSLLFLPLIAYHVYQYMVLFRYAERYVIYEAELSKFIPLQEHSIDAVIAYNDVQDAILVLKEGKM